MRKRRGQLGINFYARISPEADECRRRIQERTGQALPSLIEEALRVLETKLARREQKPAA